MNSQTLLNKSQTTPVVVARITKISSLVEVSSKAKKASTSLRKVFEKGTYQKKTQLTVLSRYKRRLDSIQKQNDKNFSRKRQVKLKLPDIKKYAGNFFTKGSADDPLKAIGALAAFNTAQKLSNKDYLGAIGPGLVTAGLLFGPALFRGSAGMLMRRGGPGGGGQEAATPSTTSGGGLFRGTPYSQTRAGQSYAGMQAQRNLPRWAQRASGGSASRFAASNERLIQGTANIGDRSRLLSRRFGFGGIGGIAENIASQGGRSATQAATSKAGGAAATRLAGLGVKALLPMVNIGFAAYRFSQGDAVGGTLSLLSSIPAFGWAAVGVDLAREFGWFDGTILGRKDSLKDQTKEQKKAIEEKKKKDQGKLTFSKTLNSYDKTVTKFEEFSKSFVPSTRAKSTYIEGREPLPPPPPPGQNVKINSQVVQDAVDFRNQFPLGRGTPNSSMAPYELQMRENTMLHSAGIGNDPTVERVHVQGSAHYSNTAIDIPVNSRSIGDRVAQFWRSRGYSVLWQVAGHYDHVHVQWNEGSSQAGPPTSSGNTKGYIIVPGHATGGGADGEKALVKKLAIDAYNKIKRQNPNAPVQYMDLDSMFEDTDSGWNKQKAWYENMERQGYQVLEIHMDQKGGIGKGVIRSHGQQSSVSNEWIRQGNYAYPIDWRSKPGEQPLAGPHRGVDLFELGKMKSGQYSQRDIDALNAPFVSSVLNSIRSSVRQSTVQVSPVVRQASSRDMGPRPQQPITIPIPIPQQKQQVVYAGGGSGGMMISGPSQEQLLNSFYKRVLFTTLQS